ncbi:alkaline phosphatase family protein [bacterium]|nr:alkaline phosphatase family protein [bacterium]
MFKKRLLVALPIIILFSILILSCGGSNFKTAGKKVVILGIDGMDPNLLQLFMDQGVLPTFAKFAAEGTFTPLTTSQPPQSPVAWSNFITGMDPGGHGIFDFIHRHPQNRVPYLSTSGTEPASNILKIGKYQIPMKGGKALQMREGKSFWEILEEHGIPAVVWKIPANFPPVESKQKTFSGMGAPDILGTYGIFTFFTDDSALYQDDVAGGQITMVDIENGVIHTQIKGPTNSLVKGEPPSYADFTIYIDPVEDNIRIEMGDEDILLRPGEWSGWAEVKFNFIKGFASASGIVKFHLRSVRPHFELYCSPVNLSPEKPAMPLSTPPSYSKEMYEKIGNFYTLGIPEDTKALSAGYLGYDEFLQQSHLVLEERLREFQQTWADFEDGLYFFYFSSLDQNSHALWSTFDRESPIYDSEIDHKYGWELRDFYRQMDDVLAQVMERLSPEDLLIVMSDHGFSPFRRCFDLNTWLLDNGYITLKDTTTRDQEFFPGVDWRKTKAYGLGLNGLYLNLRGRENNGLVRPGSEAEALKDELVQKLTSVIDPQTGQQVISSVWQREDVYHGPYVEKAPDLVVGYNYGCRSSWDTSLGKFPHHVISDNPDKWSGDHCIDNKWVPGVLLTNRPIQMQNPALYDLTPTILAEFGIEPPAEMVGCSIFQPEITGR